MKKFILLFAAAGVLTGGFTARSAEPTNNIHAEMTALIDQVREKMQAGKPTEADLSEQLKKFDALVAEENGAKTDEAAQILLMKAMLYVEVLNEPDKGKAIIKSIGVNYPDTKYGKRSAEILQSIDKQADAAKEQAEAKAKQDKILGNGMAFPDFNATDLSGKPLSVGGLKGKVVLVDFWATWCGPCRGELPNVIATYKKHHGDGFEIIGVSLDSEREALDTFLKKQDGMTWAQYFDGQGWSNKLAVKYGVQSIPFAVLIGKDGKIIDKDLRGDDLEKAVAVAVAAK